MRERTLAYAASLLPEMRATRRRRRGDGAGYAWDYGPFELLGRRPPPPRRPGVLPLADIKRAEAAAPNGSASLWDIGDGVLCLEFHTKMNAIDPDIIELLAESVVLAPRALVIYNEAENFSVGANIGLAALVANLAAWPTIEAIGPAADLQRAPYAPFPVVGAPSGMALGGGCEILLHCAAVLAHAETYIGPGGGGRRPHPGLGRLQGAAGARIATPSAGARCRRCRQAFETIAPAKVARSADEAREPRLPARADRITMNRDRLLADAKAKALALAAGYQPPQPVELRLPGPSGEAALVLAVDGFALAARALPTTASCSPTWPVC